MSEPTPRFELAEAIAVLERTPAVLRAWLGGLPEAWITADEGPDTFSPFEVLGHLVSGERTDWMPRVRRILDHGDTLAFEPFDRFAHRTVSAGVPLAALLDEFTALRRRNVEALRALALTERDLERTGLHPDLGRVTLRQLLATWTVHDLAHLGQVARVMAKRYGADVGPWAAYLRILSR